MILGKKQKQLSGFSRTTQDLHSGIIVQTTAIQQTPPALRQRAMRLLAGKVSLAARIDAFGEDPSGKAIRNICVPCH